MKRLYVGGLSHSITQKDLKDRFGKFGDVEDVELRTRSDDEGVPYKTFSYINIKISDGDLKKCMTVLNKSKWKGGTLQIEAAKESFLHRLAEERQEAAAPQPAAEDKKQKMLDSLSKAGVDEFTMKAAVPGTEVPGHKDWVVSKFGRVLPVLQLRCRQGSRARTMKYDPSKYCHNIRRLDRTDGEPPPPLTPVARLAWEERGGDDDISRKRRGEFSPYETPRRKTSRPDAAGSQSAGGGARSKQTVDGAEARRLANGVKPPTPKGPAQGAGPRFTDWDLDPEEEIRKAAAAQSASHDALRPEEGEEKEVEEDTMEVVGLDYFVKSGRKDDEEENDYDSADTDELFASRKPPPLPLPALPPAEERPTPPATAALLSGHDGDRKRKMKMKKKSHAVEEEDESSDAEEEDESSDAEEEDESSDAEEEVASGKASAEQRTRNQSKKMKMLPVVDLPSSDSEEEDEEEEAADSSSDSDYDAMFSNVTRLEISLADLQKLAEVSQQASEQEAALPAERPAAKKGTTPEEILAALMEDSSEEEEETKKKKKKKTSLPAFQGTRALSEGTEGEETRRHKGREEEKEGSGGSEVKKQKLDSKATGPNINGREGTESESSDEDEEVEEEEEEEAAVKVVKNMAETASSSSSEEEEEEAVKVVKNMADSSSSDEEEEEEEAVKVVKNMADSSSSDEEEEEEEAVNVVKNMADSSSSDEEEKMPAKAASSSSSSSSSEEEEEEEEEDKQQAPPRVPLGAKEEEERQRKANARRLAAVQQRQKEAEQHKQLIQGALANLDAPRAGAGKRIVFGSDDDDDDDEDEQRATSAVTRSKATALQNGRAEVEAAGEEVRRKPKATQLFGGSEDEDEEDAEEEEDGSRFDIRPQFEGRGGQKLMELQSRFGTDERFRMDSRFLEEEEEEEDKGEESENKTSVTEEEEALEEERKKSLSILQSVLGSGGQLACGVKTPAKTKTFRDVAALHYDPSKEEHAAFETKTDAAKKESKAARRKKREEAQKLPEVSKEIYYDVSGDLKAVFGPTKDGDAAAAANANAAAEGDEEANWDQEDEAEETTKDEQPAPQSTLLSADPENEEASGFKFSFFEDAAETGSGETAEYRVESIQAPKVSWQQDLRFQDSSSDEEEEEKALEEEEEEQSGAAAAGTTQEETPSKTGGFFFFLGDSRLTEGPGSFCRPAQLEEQREQWEERRTQLREEYRKKHKDARRRLRSSLKS